MFFPIRTDRRLKRTPYMNITLIVVNVAVSLWVWGRYGNMPMMQTPVGQFMLLPWQPKLHQFFTYQFLHENWEHLAFNMLFLYVFGNSLEDRFGSIGYLAFYLAGGVVAGMGYSLTQTAPILGASGSISAVTGAYLALFPLTRVTMVFWFFFIYFFDIPAMVLLLFSFGQDLFFQVLEWTGRPGANIAFQAHLAGNLFGFLIGMALLWARILPREPYDFLALADRWRRRRELRSATRQGHSPWLGSPGTGAPIRAGKIDERQHRQMQMRAAISAAMEQRDPGRALDTYERLLSDDAKQVLPRDLQLDMGNYAMSHDRHGTAATAYELFLATYRGDGQTDQVKLLLGLIYTRYLPQPDRAKQLLTEAHEHLNDASQRQLVDELLGRLG
ncbi:MAG: rhomboid family intramembrane serine protease [Phycisphaerales bacterium]